MISMQKIAKRKKIYSTSADSLKHYSKFLDFCKSANEAKLVLNKTIVKYGKWGFYAPAENDNFLFFGEIVSTTFLEKASPFLFTKYFRKTNSTNGTGHLWFKR